MEFQLKVSVFQDTAKIRKDDNLTSIGSHCCEKNKPKLKDLQEYSKKISIHWKEIAAQLDIKEYEIATIDVNHPNDVRGKFHDMLTLWLQINKSPCWCHFIQALSLVGLNEVAEDAKKHVQNIYDNSLDSTTLPVADERQFKAKEITLSLRQFVRHLQSIPEEDLHYFVLN